MVLYFRIGVNIVLYFRIGVNIVLYFRIGVNIVGAPGTLSSVLASLGADPRGVINHTAPHQGRGKWRNNHLSLSGKLTYKNMSKLLKKKTISVNC